MGKAHYNDNSAQEFFMKDDKNNTKVPAVQVKLTLEQPVREDIYDYLVNK